MKLVLKQKLFSFLDSYEIFDQYDNVIFYVKSELTWGRLMHIYNRDNTHLATLEKVIFTFMPKYKIFVDGILLGEIQKELAFFKQSYYLNINGWVVNGNFLQWDFQILDGNETIATIQKEPFEFSDKYTINIEKDENTLLCLLIALAIDSIKDDANKSHS